jgi:ABC-type Fe3+ transport system substrate-binding protein
VTKASSSRRAVAIWPGPRILFKLPVSNTDSVGFNGNGASRAGAEAMFQKLGISEEIKPKIKLVKGSAPEAAARGEIQFGLSPQSEVIAAHGAQIVGAVPAQYGFYPTLVGAVSSASANADASKGLIKFLTAPRPLRC